MSTSNLKSFEYNGLCDVCGFKKKASELFKRWDGFMVCAEDLEARNILDFYRTRSDAHKLPFTRPDDTSDLTWTPTTTGLTPSIVTATYSYDSVNKVLSYSIQIVPSGTSVTLSNATFTLPSNYTFATDNKGTVIGSKTGQYFGPIVVDGTGKLSVSGTIIISDTCLIRGSFITT